MPRFLQHHTLAGDLVAPVSAMRLAQATPPPLFESHGAACHGDAAALARKSLVMKDGVLIGKPSGRPVSDCLRSHDDLTPDEIAAMSATLQRVLGEVGAKQASTPGRNRPEPSRTVGAARRSGQPAMSGSTSAASCASESCQPR